ncbi:MAG TPA: hypothetical protein PKN09_13100 [Novosphingobium sp.]|nr:hypothetical protein [Novosphingobium sp.]
MKIKTIAAWPLAMAAGLLVVPMQAMAKDKDDAAVEESDSVLAADIFIPAPPPGKGQILFYRKGGLGGAAVACSVHENGQKVSSLGGGKYFIMVTDPGKHEFTVKTEAKDVLTLEVEPDETQFAQCKIKMGIMVGRPDIRPSTEAEFRGMKKFKLVDDEDMGPGPGALRSTDLAAAKAKKAEPAPAATPAETPAETPAVN